MKSKGLLIFVSILLIGFIALFSFLFINCIRYYSEFDISYEDTIREEVTFEEYDIIEHSKGGNEYELYFYEHSEPFNVSGITQKKLDKRALRNLNSGDALVIYYVTDGDGYSVCEINCGTTSILKLSDYVKANQSNQLVGTIICPILILIALFLLWVAIRSHIEEIKLLKRLEDGSYKTVLGKLKIEYEKDSNLICLYNSPSICSLVINGKVVDRHFGFVASPFCLSGHARRGEKKIPVEAKMGHLFMRVYYDGKMIAKKFMAFG